MGRWGPLVYLWVLAFMMPVGSEARDWRCVGKLWELMDDGRAHRRLSPDRVSPEIQAEVQRHLKAHQEDFSVLLGLNGLRVVSYTPEGVPILELASDGATSASVVTHLFERLRNRGDLSLDEFLEGLEAWSAKAQFESHAPERVQLFFNLAHGGLVLGMRDSYTEQVLVAGVVQGGEIDSAETLAWVVRAMIGRDGPR